MDQSSLDEGAFGDFDFDELETNVEAPTGERQRAVDDRLITTYLERRSPWKAITRWAIIVFVILAFAQEAVGVYYDRKMTAAAQQVAGSTNVEVHCRRIWDEIISFNPHAGYVEFGSGVANLQFNQCYNAARWSSDPTADNVRIGVHVLAHEVAHVMGHYSEGETECVAMWALPEMSVALGGTAEEGAVAARWYATEINPLLVGNYQAPGCLAGDRPNSPMLN